MWNNYNQFIPPYGGGMQQQSYYNTPKQQNSNKILVTSLEDALNRTSMPNSDIIYIDQDKPFIYHVVTDINGRKTYKTFELKELNPNQQSQQFATKDELKALEEKISTLFGGIKNESTQQ